MYTKEDVGTLVYLPGYGDKPLEIISYEEGEKYPVKVGFSDEKTPFESFASDGKEYEDHHSPTLSRTPYIVGEPFHCVTEKPQRSLEEIKASEEPPTEEEWARLRDELASPKLRVGDLVLHPVFGAGRIIRQGGGPELTEGVQFLPTAQHPQGLFQWVSDYLLTRQKTSNND